MQSGLPAISGPLAALMQLKQAEQALKQAASPVTPSGQPTVAGQAMQTAQALTQARQPQPQPQAGIENLLPGVQQQAVMQEQAQQPVTQAQLQQKLQAMQGQQSGVAQLPNSDVNMAEGGVVGYNGQNDSQYIRSPEEEEPSGEKSEWLRSIKDFLRGKGTVYDWSQLDKPSSQTAANGQYKGKSGIADEDIGIPETPPKARVLPPAAGARIGASSAASATGASNFDKYVKLIADQTQAAETAATASLQEAAKRRELTPEELAFVAAQQEKVRLSREQLEEQKRRFLELEGQRAAAGKPSARQALEDYAINVGGARSLAAGLAQAGKARSAFEASQRAESQKALERQREYFDLLDTRKDAIEQRDLAIAQGKMERAKAEQDRIQEINKALATSRTQLRGDQVKAIGSLAGHALTAEESAKARSFAAAQSDEARKLGLLGRLDQAKIEELRKVREDHTKDPKFRLIYQLAALAAQSPGGKLTDEQQAQLAVAEQVLAKKEQQIIGTFNPRISQIETSIWGAPTTGVDLSKWGNLNVTPGKR